MIRIEGHPEKEVVIDPKKYDGKESAFDLKEGSFVFASLEIDIRSLNRRVSTFRFYALFKVNELKLSSWVSKVKFFF